MKSWIAVFSFFVTLFSSEAVQCRWTGASGGKWSEPSNWDGNVPQAGDTLLFEVTSDGEYEMLNDLSGLTVSGITLHGSAGTLRITGNAPLGFSAENRGLVADVTGTTELALPLRLDGPVVVSNTVLPVAKNQVNAQKILLSGQITGSGKIEKYGRGTLTLSGNNSFSGGVSQYDGLVYYTGTNAAGTGPIRQEKKSYQYNALTDEMINGGGVQLGWFQFNGPVTITNEVFASGENLNAGSFHFGGDGPVRFAGPVTVAGQTRLQGGKVVFDSSLQSTEGGLLINNNNGDASTTFNAPVSCPNKQVYSDGTGTWYWNAQANQLGSFKHYNSRQVWGVDQPFVTNLTYDMGNSKYAIMDLQGHKQVFSRFTTFAQRSGGTVNLLTSAEPGGCLHWTGTGAKQIYLSLSGAVSLCFDNPDGAVWKAGTISTKGTFTVSNGTVTAESAVKFSSLSRIEVADNAAFVSTGAVSYVEEISVGNGARFEVGGLDVTSAFVLRLASTATFTTAKGIYSCAELWLDGERMPSGIYQRESVESGVHALPILSDGVVLVVEEEELSAVEAVWDGGAADDYLTTPANWLSDEVPDLYAGNLQMIVSPISSCVVVTNAAFFKEMVWTNQTQTTHALASQGGKFIFRNGGPVLTNQTEVAVEDAAEIQFARRGTLMVGVSSDVLNPKVVWRQRGVWSDYVVCDTIVKEGCGDLHLFGTNTFSGDFVLSNGNVHAWSDDAFGSPSGKTILQTITRYVDGKNKSPNRVKLFFNGITTDESFEIRGNDQSVCGTLANSTNVIRGLFRAVGGNMRFNLGANSVFILAGGFESPTLPLFFGGTVVITNKPYNGSFYKDGSGLFVFATTNNFVGGGNTLGGGSVEDPSVVRTDVENAFTDASSFTMGVAYGNGGGVLDLNGFDQRLNYVQQSEYFKNVPAIRSDKPATLRFVSTSGKTRTLWTDFQGAVSLCNAGTDTYILHHPASTTGDLINEGSGRIQVAQDAAWLHGNLSAQSGTIQLTHGAVLSKTAKVTIGSTGKIELDAGVFQRVGELWIDGVKAAAGTHGTTASGANHADDTHFAGTGLMQIVGNGTVLFVR